MKQIQRKVDSQVEIERPKAERVRERFDEERVEDEAGRKERWMRRAGLKRKVKRRRKESKKKKNAAVSAGCDRWRCGGGSKNSSFR
jgi:hypothetical protein